MITERMRQGLNRLKEAMTGRPDRVPVVAQIGAHTTRLTGLPVRDFLADPELFIRTHLQVSEYYHLDAPSFFYDLYNIEAEALGQPLVWLEGEFPEIKAGDMLIKRPADLDRLRPPRPGRDGRMPFVVEIYKRMADLGLPVQFRFCAPFSLAGNVRGLSDLVMDMMVRPEFAHRLFTFLTDEVLAPFVTALRRECGADYPALGADALASLPVTNLKILEEYALGYAERLGRLVGGIQVRGWWGEQYLQDPDRLLELKRKGHPTCVLGLDPDVDRIGPEKFKRFAEKYDSPLMLGVDCALIAQGPLKAIVERVGRYVRAGGRGGRFILFLNEVPPGCPPEHVHAAVQAAEYYSRIDPGPPAGPFEPRSRPEFRAWAAGEVR